MMHVASRCPSIDTFLGELDSLGANITGDAVV